MGNRKKAAVVFLCLTMVFVTAVSALPTNTGVTVQQNEPAAELPQTYAMAEPKGQAPVGSLSPGDTAMAESANLQLYLNKKTGVVKVVDRSNGYIWSSNSQSEDLSGLNKYWKSFSKSIIAVDYVNADGKVKQLASSAAEDIEYTKIENGFEIKASFEDESIAVGADVTLNNGTLTVTVPDGIIQDNDEHKVCAVTIMPFFGAVREDSIPGYSLIPDGCGALIRFDKSQHYTSPYKAEIYGEDLGVIRKQQDQAVEVKRAAVPVFGMAHGSRQNAFLAIAEKGAEYGEIQSYPAGVVTPFNWTCFSFTYRNQYFQKTDKENGGYSTYSKSRNSFDIEVSYTFLSNEDASYTGMAVKYRERLNYEEKSGDLSGSGDIPLRIEALMSEVGPSVVGTQVISMTKAGDVQNWVGSLSDAGIHKINLSLSGWEKGGLNGHNLSQNSPDSQTGTKSEYENLIKQVEQAGGNVYFVKNIVSGYEGQLNLSHNGIVNIDGTVASQTNSSAPLLKTLYYCNSRTASTLIQSIISDDFLKDKSIALEGISSNLYSDYSKNYPVTRADALQETVKSLMVLPSPKQALYSPNAYAFSCAGSIFDMPVTGSGYLYALDYVPFLQTILSGRAEMYAPCCNFNINSKSDILRLIDFDVYPSFILTQKPSYLLAKTNLNNVFSSAFDDWKGKMTEIYNEINPVLSQVSGKRILKREVVQDGVSVVTYEGNIKICINYTNDPVTCKNGTVNPLSASVTPD